MQGRQWLLPVLAFSYGVAFTQVWLWAPLNESWLPAKLAPGPALEILSFGLAIGWLAIAIFAISRFGRYGLFVLPGAPMAFLPALAVAAIYAACAFENNCL